MQIWENYHRFAVRRAELVVDILSQFIDLAEKHVLDVGSGNGTTAKVMLDFGAEVTAIDPLAENSSDGSIRFIQNKFEDENFAPQSFDVIVLQDVLEHLPEPDAALQKCSDLLKKNGVLYIATPNRFSVINLLSDPHWQLPVVAALPRSGVKFLVHSIFRKDHRKREDWAALISLSELFHLLKKNHFKFVFVNQFVAGRLFEKPEAVVCAPSHLRIVNFFKKRKWAGKIVSLVNDDPGFFNFLINPTWYLIGIRR